MKNRRISEDRWLGPARTGALGLSLFFLVSWLVGIYFYISGIANDLDQVLAHVIGYGAWTTTSIRPAAAELGIRPKLLAWLWLSIEIIVLVIFGAAALFQPLRRRVQDIIDRRFFRRKYDSARTLAQFSERARDEVELERLMVDLLQVVDETMKPGRVILWMPDQGKPIFQTNVEYQNQLARFRTKLEGNHA